jgi:hypothetical protein
LAALAIILGAGASVALGQNLTSDGGGTSELANGCPLNDWRFAAYGDQSAGNEARQLVQQIRSWHAPDACYPFQLVAHAGDVSYYGDADSTDRLWWNGAVAPLRAIPLGNGGRNYVLALGNHDQDTEELRQWYLSNIIYPLLSQTEWPTWVCEQGGQPDRCERMIYSYSYRNAHFIAADLDGGGNPGGFDRARDTRIGPRVVNWIARDIERAKSATGGCKDDAGRPAPCDWIFYLSHPPCYSLEGLIGEGYEGHGDDTLNCNQLEPTFALGVDVVIQGHTHQYYRTFPMLPGDHAHPQPSCGANCPEEDYTGDDLAGATIYLTVGTGGAELYPNEDWTWRASRERLNAYAAAFPVAGGEIRDTGPGADGNVIRRVPLTIGASRFTIAGRCLLMEFVNTQGVILDQFTIDKDRGACVF